MSIDNVKPIKADARNLLISFAVAAVITAIIITTMIVGKNMLASGAEENKNDVVISQEFNSEDNNNILLSTETISYTTGATPWTISTGNTYSNKQAIEAADARNLALSRQAAASIRAIGAGSAIPQNGNAPGSPAPVAPDNRYAPGNCTWYAYNRRYQLGNPVPNLLGNGGYWHVSAAQRGMSVDHSPRVGDVIDMPGHVAIVEAVGENNTVFISEMNVRGLYSYNTRWVSNATSYWFIH